jgi:hypothetical protein
LPLGYERNAPLGRTCPDGIFYLLSFIFYLLSFIFHRSLILLPSPNLHRIKKRVKMKEGGAKGGEPKGAFPFILYSFIFTLYDVCLEEEKLINFQF